MTSITELAEKLNGTETNTGDILLATVVNDELIKVSSTEDPDATVSLIETDEQLLSITPLFRLDDVDKARHKEFFEVMLRLSLVIPLSSLGLQDDYVVLFGSMSINTVFDNIVEELDAQIDSYSDVLDALSEFVTA